MSTVDAAIINYITNGGSSSGGSGGSNGTTEDEYRNMKDIVSQTTITSSTDYYEISFGLDTLSTENFDRAPRTGDVIRLPLNDGSVLNLIVMCYKNNPNVDNTGIISAYEPVKGLMLNGTLDNNMGCYHIRIQIPKKHYELNEADFDTLIQSEPYGYFRPVKLSNETMFYILTMCGGVCNWA